MHSPLTLKQKIGYAVILLICALLVFVKSYKEHQEQLDKEILSNIELVNYYQDLTDANQNKPALIIEYLLLNSLLESTKLEHQQVKQFVLQDKGQMWHSVKNKELFSVFNNENLRLISFVLSMLNTDITDEEQNHIIINACVNKFDMLYEIDTKVKSNNITATQSLLAKQIILEPYHSLFQNPLVDSFLKESLNIKL